jgi:transposase
LGNYTKWQEKKMWKTEQASLVIIDSQAVKNTDCASETWWCHYKCTNGIKRHLLVDVLGIPISILVTKADVNDRVWWKMIARRDKELLRWIKIMLGDCGYLSRWFKISIKKLTWISVIIAPKVTKKKWEWFKPEHKRWIVERSNAWMEKCRRLHKNNERYLQTSENMCKLCFIRILARRLAT